MPLSVCDADREAGCIDVFYQETGPKTEVLLVAYDYGTGAVWDRWAIHLLSPKGHGLRLSGGDWRSAHDLFRSNTDESWI